MRAASGWLQGEGCSRPYAPKRALYSTVSSHETGADITSFIRNMFAPIVNLCSTGTCMGLGSHHGTRHSGKLTVGICFFQTDAAFCCVGSRHAALLAEAPLPSQSQVALTLRPQSVAPYGHSSCPAAQPCRQPTSQPTCSTFLPHPLEPSAP